MSWFDPKRAFSVARKEVFHISRDPFTIALATLVPVVMVTVFGWSIDFNVKDIRLSVFDGDRTQASRQLIETFRSSEYFKPVYKNRTQELLRDLDADRARGVLVIEPGFEKDLEAGQGARVQLVLDGTDNTTVGVIMSYLPGIQSAATWKLTGIRPAPAVQLKTRYLFNPELNSAWFIVPGLAVVLIAILSILLTSLTVAREWENGSMELLLSTPVRPIEIIVGKLAPYAALGFSAILFVYLAARLGFGVPFRGSHLLFLVASALFLFCYLAQGLLISVITRKQPLAMQLGIISGLLPSLLLSGFIFPIESMPAFFQYFTSILPARWFMVISRGIFLKGSGLEGLARPLLALLVLAVVLTTLATRRFKKDLEP